VRTLRYLRERSARSSAQSDSDLGSLVVAMSQTPGTQLRDLANAGPEADLVARILPDPVLLTHEITVGDAPGTRPVAESASQPTTGRVLTELARSRVAHFACHAEADTMNPSRSGLRLLDASLTVSALGAQDLDSVVFAFLSASSTALNRARNLLDESIHVVSAFQLAGIPQVVGTFWEVEDFASLTVVQSFYTRLGAGGLDTSAAAETLHEIIRLVRDEVPDAPWIWAAHMYAGC
jgi:CHAT domain-containing protein